MNVFLILNLILDIVYDTDSTINVDIKHVNNDGYLDLTGNTMDEFKKFVSCLNKSNTKVWIRQVIIPGVNDNISYMNDLNQFLTGINNIEKIEFLPYHKMGDDKYLKLGINNLYLDKEAMDKEKCDLLYNYLISLRK